MLRTMLTRRMPIKGPRTKKCAVKTCRAPFVPEKTFITWCSPECGHSIAVAKLAKQKTAQARAARKAVRMDRAETKKKLAALRTRNEWLKDAQAVFNAWARARDAHQPCISCGQVHDRFWDAGHYRSIGAQPALRFHEDNVHKQCVHCNQHKSGNAIEYRLGLVARIGAERVAFLEQEHSPVKYTIEDARRIKAEYAAKLRAMKSDMVATT